ncbi:MAG: hypothetical protein WBG67_06510, partial [Thermoanaerobaculia bacterium]
MWLNSRHLERLFRAEILRMLVDKGLIGEETVRNLLAWRHSGFSVHGAVQVDNREAAARLGRYMIRYWGWYANAARGKRHKAHKEAGASPKLAREDTVDAFTCRARLSWAKLIKRVYEVDPILCPFCGTEMKIIAFINDFATARAIHRAAPVRLCPKSTPSSGSNDALLFSFHDRVLEFGPTRRIPQLGGLQAPYTQASRPGLEKRSPIRP